MAIPQLRPGPAWQDAALVALKLLTGEPCASGAVSADAVSAGAVSADAVSADAVTSAPPAVVIPSKAVWPWLADGIGEPMACRAQGFGAFAFRLRGAGQIAAAVAAETPLVSLPQTGDRRRRIRRGSLGRGGRRGGRGYGGRGYGGRRSGGATHTVCGGNAAAHGGEK
jgi:uncharacterized membrane protein YgcG